MGKRGPPPKPTVLRILEGNPGKRKIATDEPKPRGKAICPDFVCDPGKELWNQLAPDLIREGLLTGRSAHEFAAYCHERAIYEVYSALLKELRPKDKRVERYRGLARRANEAALRLGARFGMTPSDQKGLVVKADYGSSDEDFLFGRTGNAKA